MATIRNPKQEGTPFFDCIVQTGICPNNCNQCFYNRPGAYYVPLDQLPLIPMPEEVGKGIVRMNCGHDSNIEREKVIAASLKYENAFFNTSICRFDFPGPVVLTANPNEEKPPHLVNPIPDNLMFVRLRTSGTNLRHIDDAVTYYTLRGVPVVITFMAYYDKLPVVDLSELDETFDCVDQCYTWKVRHVNSYWCATTKFMQTVMKRYQGNRLVSMCGSYASGYCRACRNCETYYYQTQKRLRGE